MLTPMQIKAALYDLGQVWIALVVERPSEVAVGEAKKAMPRLRERLGQVEALPTWVGSALDTIDLCLVQQARPAKLFAAPRPERALNQARAAHERATQYVQGLRAALAVCGLDQGAADRAAGLAS